MESLWCDITQTTVRALGVVLEPPAFDDDLGFQHTDKRFKLQALIPQAGMEAFHEAVLLRGAGINVMCVNALMVEPKAQALSNKLGTVIAADKLRVAGDGKDLG